MTLRFGTSILSAILTTAFLQGPLQAATVIKLGSLAPAGSPWDQGLKRIAAEWTKISGGTVQLKIYPGGIAGDEEDMLRKMRIGQLSAAGLTGVGLCRIHTGILSLQLPLVVRSDDELIRVLDDMKPQYEKAISEQGFTVLVWTRIGWVHFFSKRPVVTPDDLRSQKLFVWAGDAAAVQAWKEAGFHPVPLAVTDLMSSVQSGMVEAFSTTPLSAVSYQWYNLTKNMCGMRWAPLIGGIIVNNSTWQRIPAELRQKLLASAQTIGGQMQAEIDKADREAVNAMQQQGVKVSTVSTEVERQWQEIIQAAFVKVTNKSFDQATLEQIQEHLIRYRSENGR